MKNYFNIYKTKENERWEKVGVGFLNKDGSYNLRLKESITPADQLQMREPRTKEKVKEQSQQQGVEAGAA